VPRDLERLDAPVGQNEVKVARLLHAWKVSADQLRVQHRCSSGTGPKL
jgi:hypothetical protein